MIVFKSYFKIIRRHLGLIIMFSFISIGISIINTSYSNSNKTYIDTNPTLAIINYDSSLLTDNFIDYISENSEIKEINDDKREIQDVLYNNEVDAVLIIPKSFTVDFFNNKNPQIEIKKGIEDASEYTFALVNRYYKIANIYSSSLMSEREIVERINIDLDEEIEVEITSNSKSELEKLAIFYSFENYAFLSIFVFIIGTIMCIFNKDEIRKRNFVSKTNPMYFLRQLFLGHVCFTLSIWFIFVIVSVVIYKDLMFNLNGLLLIINSLMFTITATSLAYLIGNLIKKDSVISGIGNVVSLGLSFISGCFVPIELLDKNIVNFSKIFPSYWFISNNYEIVKMSRFDFLTLKPILINFLVILVFGIVYYMFSKVVVNKKKSI